MRQIRWMDKGYTEDVAFAKTEEELSQNMVEARSHAAMLYEIGTSTSMRSYMDYYEQVAEYEGRLKVKQMARDIPKFLRSTQEFSVFSETPQINEWERMTQKFSAKEDSPPDKSFLSKVKHLTEFANEKANKYDGIQGLSDSMIMWTARDAYRHLKKTSKGLVEELTELGVKLDENSELDVSAVSNKDLQQALKLNPMISAVFKQDFTARYPETHAEPEVQTTEAYGSTAVPEIKWASQNPYKQSLGMLKAGEVESKEERIERLKRLWHKGRKNNNEDDQFKLQQDAVKALRAVRMRLDQAMVEHGQEPVFPKNREYTKEELMITHKVDVERMSKFLATEKQKLFETEVDQEEYAEIEKMIEPMTIVENLEPIGYDKNMGSIRRAKDIDEESSEEEGSEEEEEEEEEGKREGRGNRTLAKESAKTLLERSIIKEDN